MHGRVHHAYLQTHIRICGQIIIRIVYNEPNALSPLYFNQNEKSAFERCLTLFYYRLLHLVILRHIIRTYSVRISKPCMDGVCSMEYSYEKSSLICFIFQSLSKYRKAALKFEIRFQIFIIFFNWRYVM